MRLVDFVEALRRYPNANELSVHSDGGYFYSVVDASGKKISPAELGINLDFGFDDGEYVRVEGDVYSHKATITPSDDEGVDGHVRRVTQLSDSEAVVVEGDIP